MTRGEKWNAYTSLWNADAKCESWWNTCYVDVFFSSIVLLVTEDEEKKEMTIELVNEK